MINKVTSGIYWQIMRLIRFYRNISIKKKIFLILYIQILIPLIFIGYFSFKTSENIIVEKSKTYSNELLSIIELRLQDTINNLNMLTQNIGNDEGIYSALLNDDSSINRLQNYEVRADIINAFQKIVPNQNNILALCIVTKTVKIIEYDRNSVESDIKSVVLQNYTDMQKYARAAGGGSVWYFDSNDNAYLIKMIYNRDNYQEIGLLVVQIDKQSFKGTLGGSESELMKNLTILSPDNSIIYCRDKATFNKYRKTIQDTFNGVDNKAKIFVASRTLGELRWTIVTYIPLKQLHADVEGLRTNMILICLAAILLLTFVSFFVSFDMIKPINQLVTAMKGMNIHKISSSYIEIDRNDELGFLQKTFNTMTKEMDHLVNWIYREQITRKEAEIKALQSQINPHFLFNTLESINWMAQLNNIPEISETVSDLSTLLDISIGRDDRLITIEEEFIYIDKYISLLKRRFEDKITLNKEVNPQVLYLKIPRLLIQPLIENAVYHGVENNRGKGIISLVADIVNDMIIIEVIDNGNGIPSEELIKLNNGLSMDNNTYFNSLSNKKDKSIGIENVNRRIKLFYGEKYGLKIESKVNIYTKVSVTLPVQIHNTKEGYYVQGSNN
ncbi:sensor histidine kinase [Ruminiclostridium herbifermentans]|uniref:Sensor histidine kinase n=1 Tax=Ruminiclostridium herbifermentans TaxID=2488810 RepID=A0A4U7JL89_9FIRM|nr:sensor histidine kinase [Ruminiclostridium herbifermentans]QNU68333.1 sensor histidine kinase [Ruminiclostridium herbifermentans]